MTSFTQHIFAALLVVSTGLASADTLAGKVVGISDGDTITILDTANRQFHVRLAGIDAPEKNQAFGQTAKKAMSQCAFGKQVVIEWSKHDRYNRIIGILIADGFDCGLRQIELGLAWHYKAYEREQRPEDRLAYERAENNARASGIGLWSDKSPLPPWVFRHAKASLTSNSEHTNP